MSGRTVDEVVRTHADPDRFPPDRFPPVGYLSDWTVRPGQHVDIHMSSPAELVECRLVRLSSHDQGSPAGPTVVEQHLPSTLDGVRLEGRVQPIHLGSWLDIEDPITVTDGITLDVWFLVTLLDGSPSTILSLVEEGAPAGGGMTCRAVVLGDGSPAVVLGPVGGGERTLQLGGHVLVDRWYRLRIEHDFLSGAVTCKVWAATDLAGGSLEPSARAEHVLVVPEARRFLLRFAAAHGPDGPSDHLDGKLGSLRLYGSSVPVADSGLGGRGSVQPLARWDLARELDTDRAVDVSGNAHHGRLRNRPLRGVTGRSWDGTVQHPDDDPSQYDAVRFHRDDVGDVGWEVSASFVLDPTLPSGAYAVRLDDGTNVNHLPFFVVGAAGPRHSRPLAVVIPTFTYLAYADEHIFERPRAHEWILEVHGIEHVPYPVDVYDAYILAHGLSGMYDLHPDGSGVHLSCRRRPIVNVRPDARMRHLSTGEGAPHCFGQDIHLLGWLGREGLAYDVLTDEAVHAGGAELLATYRSVVYASHPEYITEAIMDATATHVEDGGRVLYLGGNGFYWVVSLDPHTGDTIELRRFAGTQGWTAAPGERHHAMTGEVGGTWRGRGRAPQSVVGVGFCAQGFDRNTVYHRSEDSYRPEVAWVFDGVAGEVIGDEPNIVNVHGAAGFEVDRVDPALGTHPDTVVLASATEFAPSYVPCDEDLALSDRGDGALLPPGVRSDLILRVSDEGGALFSVGSIAWTGALWARGGDGDVARITRNVLRRFTAEGPLAGLR
jgi:N,N-dimethylformamidase